MAETEQGWRIAGLVMLPVRFVQGWIFWGGGSRRFIYDPSKLDPYAHSWMANKLQSAMPGAILGTSDIISFLLLHFDLLYASIILFSLAELLSGLALITGTFTRLAAYVTIVVSITLMLAFGWQGATCMDEWTMAVATLAMSIALAMSGASAYSVDNLIRHTYPKLANKRWFILLASGPLPSALFKRILVGFMGFLLAFTLVTYNYYRGSIFTPYHSGPVSAGVHHINLTQGQVKKDGMVTVTLYVDAGTSALPSYIIRIELLDEKKHELAVWDAQTLSQLPDADINNEYAYNRIHSGSNSLVAPLSAKATIMLRPGKALSLSGHGYWLMIYTISGQKYETALGFKS